MEEIGRSLSMRLVGRPGLEETGPLQELVGLTGTPTKMLRYPLSGPLQDNSISSTYCLRLERALPNFYKFVLHLLELLISSTLTRVGVTPWEGCGTFSFWPLIAVTPIANATIAYLQELSNMLERVALQPQF
jgi:hypothetical protein